MDAPRFNLVDEGWIPIAGGCRASLSEIFRDRRFRRLGGTARQKIAVMKLLLAIAQAAATPADDAEWTEMGSSGMAAACADYLQKWHDAFYLYGPRPFLQMPVGKAKLLPFNSVLPEIATGNNPRFMHLQCARDLDDAEKALLLLTEMGMALGGKKGDKTVILAKDYSKKSAAPGPGTGFMGILHTFLTGAFILETVWFNLLTRKTIDALAQLPSGLGKAPWEEMPETEACEVAGRLKGSLMGRLVPLSRFCLLDDGGLHFTEGIVHLNHKFGLWDPSAAAKQDKKDIKMLWSDPEKRPWRSLSSLLSFLNASSDNTGFTCIQVEMGIPRLALAGVSQFGVWSGGLRVSSNAGEQYVSGSDDYVESEVELDREDLDNAAWYSALALKMQWLEQLSKVLYGCVIGYYKEQGEDAKGQAEQACGVFWEASEKVFPRLLSACARPEGMPGVEKELENIVLDTYDGFCPQDTVRQICAWAKCHPHLKNAMPQGKDCQ